MQNDMIWREWQRQHPGLGARGLEEAFVRKFWPRAVEGARATLARMLALPGDEGLKNEISEALILDKQLVRGRAENHKLIGTGV